MIIYQKIEKNLVIPCGLGPSVCPETGYDLQSKTVDSSIALQTVEPDSGYYGLYRVIVNPIHDDNLLSGNIKNGVEILGVMGTYAGEMIRLQAKTVDPSTASITVTFDPSYDGLSSVTVNPYVLDSKTVDPSTAAQTVTSDADGLSSVTVNAAPLQNRTIDPSTVLIDVQRTSNDYFGLRHVYVNPVTSDIDPDIQAGNIKEGVEILGVVGTFQGGTLQSKTVNSSTSSQTITPDGQNYGLSSVTVNPYTLDSKTVDSSTVSQTINSSADGLSSVTVNPYTLEAKTQNITQNGTYTVTPSNADGLSSVDISVNVADIPAVLQTKSVSYNQNGEYQVEPDQGYEGISHIDISVNVPDVPPELQSKTVDSSTSSQTVTADQNYDGLSSVTVNPYVLDSKTVDSSTVSQTITSSEDGLSSVTVNPYTLDTKTVDPSTSSITVNSSADGLSSVTVNAVTSSIDPDIVPGNIKSGVNILGVTGTYDGSGGGGDSSLYAVMHSLILTLNDSRESTSTYVETGASLIEEPTYFEMVFKAPESEDGNKHWIFGCEHAPLRAPVQLPFFGAYVIDDTLYISAGQTQDNCVALDNDTYHFSDGIYITGEVVEDPEDSENTVWQIKINNNSKDLYYLPYETLSGYNPICIFAKDDGNGNFSEFAESGTEFMHVWISNEDEELDFYAAGEIEKDYDGNLNTSIAQTPYIMFYDYDNVNDSYTVDLIAPEIGEYDTVQAQNITIDYTAEYYTPEAGIRMMPFGYDMPAFTEVQEPSSTQLTVNPSTSSQTFYPAHERVDYFNEVTVNAVTSSIDPDIVPGNIKSGVNILGVVGTYEGASINNQNKTVNPSTNSQSITADQGYTGLGTVTVNAVTAAIDPDISAGNIRRGVNILGVIGTYDGSSNSNWIMDTKKGVITDLVTDTEGLNAFEYGLRSLFMDVDTLNSVTFTNSSANANAFSYVCKYCSNLTSGSFPNLTSTGVAGLDGVFESCPNLSHVDFPELTTVQSGGLAAGMQFCCTNSNIVDTSVTFPKLTDVGNSGMALGFNRSGFSSVSFPVLTRVAGQGFLEAFGGHAGERCVQDVSFPNLAVCDYDYVGSNGHGRGAFHQAFRHNDAITSLSFPSLTTGTDGILGTFDYAFSACSNLTSISLPLFTSPISPSSIEDCSSLVSITANPLAIGTTWLSDSSYESYNESPSVFKTNTNPTLTTVTLTQDASDNISFSGCSALSAATVLHILEHLDLTVSGKTCTFYSNGLFVEDDAQGSIQNAYDDAEDAGWTIINLVITPHGSSVNYVTSISQPSARNVSMPIPEVYSCDTVVEMDYYCPDTANVDAPIGGFVRSVYMCRIIFNLDVLGGTVIDYDRDGNARTVVDDSYTVGARHTLELDQYNNGTHYQKISVDGSNVATARVAKTTVHDLSNGAYFDLFKIDNSYAMPGFTYYRFKWYEYINGTKTLVHDYKPALDPNNVPGFYDEVTQQYLLPESGTLDYTP